MSNWYDDLEDKAQRDYHAAVDATVVRVRRADGSDRDLSGSVQGVNAAPTGRAASPLGATTMSLIGAGYIAVYLPGDRVALPLDGGREVVEVVSNSNPTPREDNPQWDESAAANGLREVSLDELHMRRGGED